MACKCGCLISIGRTGRDRPYATRCVRFVSASGRLVLTIGKLGTTRGQLAYYDAAEFMALMQGRSPTAGAGASDDGGAVDSHCNAEESPARPPAPARPSARVGRSGFPDAWHFPSGVVGSRRRAAAGSGDSGGPQSPLLHWES